MIEWIALGAVLALPLAGLVGYIWLGQREARKQAEFDAFRAANVARCLKYVDDPKQTGVGSWCAPGPAAEQKRMFVLRFEDQDRGEAHYTDEAEARAMFARAEARGWNCHLFVHVNRVAPVAPAEPAEGWVLVPKRMTQEMRDVTDSEGWTWEDLLAEAGSISQEEYAAIAAAPVVPASPITVEAVAEVRSGDAGLELDWLIEGGVCPVTWNCPKNDKPCWQNCRGFECRDRDDDRVTLGGGLPGDPNGEQAALAVEVLVRKYEGAMLRETLREALSEAYLMGAQNILGRL